MQMLNDKNVRDMLIYVADKIVESKPYLTDIDSNIGDGDHGISMANGMIKAKAKLRTIDDVNDIYSLFTAMGKSILMSTGGASGVIFGSMFFEGAKGMEPKKEISTKDFAVIMRKGLNAIQERGKANVGDKTMVDALFPAVEAMEASWIDGFGVMLDKAAEAAKYGMENTKNYIARYGRAKSLMERAIGYQDAGATSVWIIFRSMSEYVNQLG